MKRLKRRRPAGTAGFTLLEALIATTLMGLVLAAIGAITAPSGCPLGTVGSCAFNAAMCSRSQGAVFFGSSVTA